MVFAEWTVGSMFWSFLWFFLFFIWIWLLIIVFSDIFRSRDMGGWAKAIWVIFVIAAPYLGVLVYLIARGGKMSEHAAEDAKRRDEQMRAYVQSVTTSTASPAEELTKLAALKDQGVITEAEFNEMKAKLVTS